MSKFLFPVYFDTRQLTKREKELIRIFFQRKQCGAGGDCSAVEEVDDRTYKICFREKEDRDSLLERSEHTIYVPSGLLRLATTPQRNRENTRTEDFFEKTLPLDNYLLNYLRDSPKALTALRNELSSLGCTVELNFAEERAVVRGSKSKVGGASDGGSEKRVNQILVDLSARYTSHNITDQKQIEKLIQGASIQMDDLRVYKESNHVVIVGKVEAVKEKLEDMQKTQLSRKELLVQENLYELIEEQFSREMRACCPNVKISSVSGAVILEGPDTELQVGAEKLHELLQKIQKRNMKLPESLTRFMKSCGAVAKYQTRFSKSLCSPVLLEIASDLVMSSLSLEAITRAKATIERDFAEEVVCLPVDMATTDDFDKIKETLIGVENAAKRNEPKVEVSFIPASSGNAETEVQMVGYREDVQRLKDILHDFQMDYLLTQKIIKLSDPELVNYFNQILQLIGTNCSGLTFKTSHEPFPSVLVSGPQCKVLQFQSDLQASLPNFTKEHLVIKGPGVEFYFDNEGETDKKSIEDLCKVVIRQQPQDLTSIQNTASASAAVSEVYCDMTNGPIQYPMVNSSTNDPLNKTKLEIKIGHLADEEVEVLVVPMIAGKVSSKMYGTKLQEAAKKVMQKNFLKTKKYPGNVISADAPPTLHSTTVFFMDLLRGDGHKDRSMLALRDGLKVCFNLCTREGHTSIALPVIRLEETRKFPLQEVIKALSEEIMHIGSLGSCSSLSLIRIIINPDCHDPEQCYRDLYTSLSEKMYDKDQAIFGSLSSNLTNLNASLDGKVNLQLVFGSILDETTDAVVNTTDFADFQTAGVCKDILSVAGPAVEAELRKATVIKGHVFQTQPGMFPCKALFHVNGEKETDVIEKLVCGIITRCDFLEYKSVAIPAICTGQGGLDPCVVANAILQAVKTSLMAGPLQHLTHIRLVLFKINVFMAFKKTAMRIFPSRAFETVVDQPSSHHPPRLTTFDPSTLRMDSSMQEITFLILGLNPRNVAEAIPKLMKLYQDQCSSETFRQTELVDLPPEDKTYLQQLVQVTGIHVEKDTSGHGKWKVSGLKDSVQEVMMLIRKIKN